MRNLRTLRNWSGILLVKRLGFLGHCCFTPWFSLPKQSARGDNLAKLTRVRDKEQILLALKKLNRQLEKVADSTFLGDCLSRTRVIKHIFEDRELEANSVVRKFRTTAADGKSYNVTFYNLDISISRQWKRPKPNTANFKYANFPR